MKKRLLSASIALGLVGIIAPVSTASATTNVDVKKCMTIDTVSPSPTDGSFTTGGKGKGTVQGNTIRLKTPVGDTEETKYNSWVRWTVDNEDFRLKHLKDLSYWTLSLNDGDRGSAAPAVRLVLDNGVNLVYEPYWNGKLITGEGAEWQTWNAGDDASKWWDSPGPAEPGSDTLGSWKSSMGNAKVKEINIGMGTWNEGADAKAKRLKFSYKKPCTEVVLTEPEYTGPTCDKPGTVMIPSELPEGVKSYDISEMKDGKVTVSVKVKKGYMLPKGWEPWEYVVSQLTGDDGCSTPTPTPTPTDTESPNPTTSPSPTETPEPTPSVTTEPTPSTTPSEVTPTSDQTVDPTRSPVSGDLPLTGPGGGVNTPVIAGLGGTALIALGAVMFLIARRRRQIHENMHADTAVMDLRDLR
jgi:hypothetical protein